MDVESFDSGGGGVQFDGRSSLTSSTGQSDGCMVMQRWTTAQFGDRSESVTLNSRNKHCIIVDPYCPSACKNAVMISAGRDHL